MNKRIKYLFYKQFNKGTHRLYIWLTLLSLIPLVFISLIIFISAIFNPELNPVGENNSFWQTFLSQLLTALDPGNFLVFGLVAESRPSHSLLFIICSLLSLLSGLMVVATLIGIVSSSIENVMLSFKKGKTFVVEKDHMIILGWNDQIFSIIKELEIAHENTKQICIVIMSSQETEIMRDEIENRVSLKNLDIVYRSGNILDIEDLKKIGIKDSKSIIVLADILDRDAQAIKIVLTINKLTPGDFEFKTDFSVVVGMEDEENIQLLKQISQNTITIFNIHLLQSRIIAQCCRQTGLSLVYNDLLDFDGEEIYFLKVNTANNPKHRIFLEKSFQDISYMLNDAILIGVFTNNECVIQPDKKYLFKDGDELILIQHDDDEPEIIEDLIYHEHLVCLSENLDETLKNILLINWNEDAPYILQDLNIYLKAESNVDVIINSERLSGLDINKLKEKNKLLGKFIQEDNLSQQVLRNLNLAQYDSIVLLSDNIIPDIVLSNASDAKSIITLLQLRIVLDNLNKSDIPIISQIQNPTSRDLMENEASYDVIVSNKLVGNYTCQLAENSKLELVFDEILQPDGSEFYMRDIRKYIKLNEKINFYTLCKSAGKRNEIVIGYKIKAEESLTNHGIYINPLKSKELVFHEGDQMIVLSES